MPASAAIVRPRLPLRPRLRLFSASTSRHRPITSYLPRILQPSTYFPSRSGPLPRPSAPSASSVPSRLRSREWNPATFFIWIFLLIGSQAIHTIRLKHSHEDTMRKADARIALLKEVIGKIQRGEDVDVRAVLGTGKEKEESEWEDMVREVQNEEMRWQEEQKRREEEKAKVVEEEEKRKAEARPREEGERKTGAAGKRLTAKDYELV